MRVWFATVLVSVVLGASSPRNIEISVKDTTTSNIANIHLKYPETSFGEHGFTYGDCDAKIARRDNVPMTNESGIDAEGPLAQWCCTPLE